MWWATAAVPYFYSANHTETLIHFTCSRNLASLSISRIGSGGSSDGEHWHLDQPCIPPFAHDVDEILSLHITLPLPRSELA